MALVQVVKPAESRFEQRLEALDAFCRYLRPRLRGRLKVERTDDGTPPPTWSPIGENEVPLDSFGVIARRYFWTFDGLTLWLKDETFIKMKPTIVNCLFGAALLGGLLFGRSLLGYVFDAVFKLTEEGWRKLTFRWGLFFFLLAALNEIVWRNFTT